MCFFGVFFALFHNSRDEGGWLRFYVFGAGKCCINHATRGGCCMIYATLPGGENDNGGVSFSGDLGPGINSRSRKVGKISKV